MRIVLKLPNGSTDTIFTAALEIESRRRTCFEVVERCLSQIDLWEPRVRAWVSIDRAGALEAARERDRELARGQRRGPLHGIPVGVKDIIDIAGLPTSAGSELRSREVAVEDAFLVARLKAAGAIILGKTVTTQFACFDPPVTRNPWNVDRTPGGSSSGSAAAVAAGMCLGAIGSQTGGSITRPASFCGVAGCKPTFGRVSVRGVLPLAPSMDHPGPLARTVRDLAILLDAFAGPDPLDLLCSPEEPPSLCAALDRPLDAPRFGRLGGMFDEMAEPAARSAVDAALAALASAGARVAPAPLPARFNDVLRQHKIVMAAETASFHERRIAEHPHDYLPHIRALIEEGLSISATEYVRSREHQRQLARDMAQSFAQADVLVCPSTVGPAPDVSSTGNPAFNAPWSYTGLPTITLPISLAPAGLPLGLQLIARHFDEATLFRAAAWCEAQLAKM